MVNSGVKEDGTVVLGGQLDHFVEAKCVSILDNGKANGTDEPYDQNQELEDVHFSRLNESIAYDRSNSGHEPDYDRRAVEWYVGNDCAHQNRATPQKKAQEEKVEEKASEGTYRSHPATVSVAFAEILIRSGDARVQAVHERLHNRHCVQKSNENGDYVADHAHTVQVGL